MTPRICDECTRNLDENEEVTEVACSYVYCMDCTITTTPAAIRAMEALAREAS